MATEQDFITRLGVERSLAYAAMAMKNYYKTHVRQWFKPGDYVYLRLGHGYDIQANQGLPKKLAQRFDLSTLTAPTISKLLKK
ncbi:hypothetical protein N7471_006453 [Penicillium samsonianum]|uniref:uncharacterized protein n=1 Tax=Penicillium samsonianum TaxID=1882272 RepID=UPI0025481E1F|nr:uncharacterized protein N7471_006453 [Penicillium samsonianum]KAJ6139967.1 hypothetical protein N7471_006453 [Penicillium samsonianum]